MSTFVNVSGCDQLCAAPIHPSLPQGVADDVRFGKGTFFFSKNNAEITFII